MEIRTSRKEMVEKDVGISSYTCDALCGAVAQAELYIKPKGWHTAPVMLIDDASLPMNVRYLLARYEGITVGSASQPFVMCSIPCLMLFMNAALAMMYLTNHPAVRR